MVRVIFTFAGERGQSVRGLFLIYNYDSPYFTVKFGVIDLCEGKRLFVRKNLPHPRDEGGSERMYYGCFSVIW